MTREEAIRKLQKQKAEYLEEWVDYSGVAEAYDIAIEALSQPIVCKDSCIDDDHIYCSPKVAARVVEALSRTGEWLFNPKDAIELMFTKPKCSKCGFESADGGNFCPNCGAKMKGADDETD